MGIDEDGVTGGGEFYHYNTPDDGLGKYYIKIFREWFEKSWEKAGEIDTENHSITCDILEKITKPLL